MVFIVGYEDPQALDSQRVGHKFAALARAVRGGFGVPEAVAIDTQAHAHYLATGNWPDGLQAEVVKTAHRLGIRQGVSIRSSATREDLTGQSFAGQYQSFLAVDTEAVILRRIEECWKSAESETLRSYLRAVNQQGSDIETPLVAVILQRMVNAAVAGVAFSRNPLRPERDEMVIEAVRGLAEGLVSGHRSPCRVHVDRNGNVSIESGTVSCRRLFRKTPWRAIAGLLRRLEASNGTEALDMEWAVDRGQTLWLLQVRPITALAAEESLPPAGVWTRKIADDLWADRLEPFMAEVMIRHAPRFDLSRIARLSGITPVLPALTVINGYLYVNCESIRRVIAHIPQALRFNDLASLLPTGSRLSDIPPPRAWTIGRILFRMVLLPLREPGMIPFICLRNVSSTIRRLRARLSLLESGATPAAPTLLKQLQADLKTLALIQENNQWPYFHATFFTWVLRWLAVDRLKMSGADFLGLISQGSDNVTMAIEQWFRKTASQIDSIPGLREPFLAKPPEALASVLPAELQAEVREFLQRYGFRSRHRTLLTRRWAEAPEEVLGILQSLVRHAQAGGAASKASVPLTKSNNPGAIFRRVLGLLAHVTRRFLDVREELRFLLDEVLFRIRSDLLVLGGLTGLDETIFFLKPTEIEEVVSGRLKPQEATHLASQRQRRFLHPVDPGVFWVDGRPEYDFCVGGTVLRGIGTSLGRATGRAVIVKEPGAAKIRAGDVVVARHTDPGWTPIFSIIGGIVTEEGGLLNHCSIVARELGIPSIVGVRRATQLIPEGARITIDGGAGMVWIEEG